MGIQALYFWLHSSGSHSLGTVSRVQILPASQKCTHEMPVGSSSNPSTQIWQEWCAVEPAGCFTPHKSWIFGQLAHYCILQGGGEICVLCFLTLGANRHDKLSHKNKLSPNTSKGSLSCVHRLKTQKNTQLCRIHMTAGTLSQPVAVNIGAGDNMIDMLCCDWWIFKTLFGHYQQNRPFGPWDSSPNTLWFDWWIHTWHASSLLSRPRYDQSP